MYQSSHPNCCCAAEQLLSFAQMLKHSSGLVLVEAVGDGRFGYIELALKLRNNPSLALRAQLEEWNQQRIVKELY